MTTEFGFCPNCGTPRISAEQRFCAECGLTLTPVTPIAPPGPPAVVAGPVEPAPPTAAVDAAAPPAWSVPPATAQPVAPPAWSTVSPSTAPPAYTGAPGYQNPPGAPGASGATRAGFKFTPRMLVIGGIVLAAIVGAYLYTNMGSKSGGISFSPSTLSCSSPVAFTLTGHLPASVHTGDTITITLDGKTAGTSQVSSGGEMTQQGDGSWVDISTTTAATMKSICAAGGSSGGFNVLTPGPHTMQILDSSGKVLAQGSYTVTP